MQKMSFTFCLNTNEVAESAAQLVSSNNYHMYMKCTVSLPVLRIVFKALGRPLPLFSNHHQDKYSTHTEEIRICKSFNSHGCVAGTC